jgi:sporulation protein YlmC with PRC-barrel domain
MLHSVKELTGLAVGARDGEVGKVKDAFFDDERWTIRHLVVDAGGWLTERKVLISPRAVRGFDWTNELIVVDLTKQQIEDSPGIDTDRPVSRQHEIDYHRYFGYPNYWEGANLWGTTMIPYPWVATSVDPMVEPSPTVDPAVARELQGRVDEEIESADVHLRSCDEVTGYDILATDGSIGEVDDFVFDDETLAIRNLVVDTRKWLPGKRVLLAPEDIDRVSWEDREVYVKLTREAVKNAPEYDPSNPAQTGGVGRAMGAAPTP